MGGCLLEDRFVPDFLTVPDRPSRGAELVVSGGGVLPLLESDGSGDAVALSEGAWASRIESEDLSGICFSGMLSDSGGVVDVLLLILLAVREDVAVDEGAVDEDVFVFVGSASGVGVGEAADGDEDFPLLPLREGIFAAVGQSFDVDPSSSRRDW